MDDEQIEAFCPMFHHAIELIGRRWTGAIIRALRCDLVRYNEIAATIPGLSDRLLSERLKELEAEGVVERAVIPETPVRIEYRLTDSGRDLIPALDAMSEWAEKWITLEGVSKPTG